MHRAQTEKYLFESALCSDVATVRAWVTSALEEQQGIMLHVMSERVKLGKAIEGSGCARCAEGKVVEEVGTVSGEHGAQKTDASTVEQSSMNSALGKPTSPVGAPGMQMEVCDVSCGNVNRAVGVTPNRPQSSAMAGVHKRGGCSAAPTMAAAQKKKKKRPVAAAQTISRGDSLMTVDNMAAQTRDLDCAAGVLVQCGGSC